MAERMRIVIVEWRDAISTNESGDEESLKEGHAPKHVTSVGIEWKYDETGITLLRDYDEDGEGDGRLFIPEGMIVRVRKLKYARE